MKRFTNINSLLAFVTVVREGSVSAAADVLNLTQPAVSYQIKRLSEETEVTLFQRTATGLQLTSEGATLLTKAEQVLEAAKDFHRAARQHAGRISGKLRIGTIIDPEFIRLGQMLSALRQNHPDIENELVHGVSGEVLARLKRGQLDAGFYLSAPEDIEQIGKDSDEPIYSTKLADFTYRVIGPVGWQNQINTASWTELASLPWIGTPEISVHHRLLKKIFDQHGVTQNVVARVDQEASMLEMVRSGIGLSLSRESIALSQKQSPGLALCDTVSVPASLSLLTLERNRQNPTVSSLFSILTQIWQPKSEA